MFSNNEEPTYFSAVEFHPLYTIYEKVPVEECGSDFLTREELHERDADCLYTQYVNGEYRRLVINQSAFSEVVNTAIETFKNRDPKRKRVSFVYDFGHQEMVNTFRRRLSDVGLKWTTNKIYEAKPKALFNKGVVRSRLFDLIEIIMSERMGGLELNIYHKNEKDVQIRMAKAVTNVFNVSFEMVWERVLVWGRWGSDDLRVEGVKEYLEEYWGECITFVKEVVDSNK